MEEGSNSANTAEAGAGSWVGTYGSRSTLDLVGVSVEGNESVTSGGGGDVDEADDVWTHAGIARAKA
jgi:hypothetical protein